MKTGFRLEWLALINRTPWEGNEREKRNCRWFSGERNESQSQRESRNSKPKCSFRKDKKQFFQSDHLLEHNRLEKDLIQEDSNVLILHQSIKTHLSVDIQQSSPPNLPILAFNFHLSLWNIIYGFGSGSIEVATEFSVFQKGTFGDQILELFSSDVMIGNPCFLSWSRWSGRVFSNQRDVVGRERKWYKER